MLGVLAATASVLSLRVAVPQFHRYQEQYSQAIKQLFQTRLVAPPTESERAMLAVIPASIVADRQRKSTGVLPEGTKPLECPDDSKAQPRCPETYIEEFTRDVFEEVNDVTLRAHEKCQVKVGQDLNSAQESKCIDDLIRDSTSIRDHTGSAPTGEQVEEMSAVVMARLAPDDPSVQPALYAGPCADFPPEQDQVTLPAPWCDRVASSRSTLLVPRQLVPGNKEMWMRRPARAIVESRLFEEVVRRFKQAEKQQNEVQSAKTGEITPDEISIWRTGRAVAAYFVSIDGLLRYWSDPLPSHPTLDAAYPSRIWSQNPYFFPILHSLNVTDKTESDLYLDITGEGLVRTYCYPVAGQSLFEGGASTGIKGDSPQLKLALIGAVCVDLVVPYSAPMIKTLLKALRQNPLIDTNAYEIIIGTENRVQTVERIAGDEAQTALPTDWPEEELEGVIKGQGCSSTTTEDSTGTQRPRWSDVLTCELTGKEVLLLIPLYRESPNRLIAMVIRPHPPQYSRELLISAAAAAISVVGMLICVFQLGGSRLQSELATQFRRLRSLPVAMMDCNERDEIVAGNDRLEETVCQAIPKFGLSGGKSETRVGELFENFAQAKERDRTNQTGTAWHPTIDATAEGAELFPVNLEEEMRRRRAAGHRSIYFASVRQRGPLPADSSADRTERTWVKIIASPVMSAEGARVFRASAEGKSTSWVPTSAVLLEVTHAERERLERWLNAEQPKTR
jgi:hypothetical protein